MSVPLGIYQHYKGNHYHVVGIARHSESLEEIVVYQSLYGDYGMWVRPLSLFQESITFNGQTIPRFKFVSAPLAHPPGVRKEG